MEKLKFGIIGCGAISRLKHFPALMRQKDRLELRAFCDIVEERAGKACEEFGDPGARAFTDYKQMLRDVDLDVVYVLTPNVSHAELTVASLMAGCHVLCEKPMAATAADAKSMLDASRESGKKLTIGYQNRFRRDSQLLYQACRAGDLGEVYFAKAHAVRRRGVPTWGVFPDKSKQGGGPLIDLATHALDLALWTMDNYQPHIVLGTTFEKMRDQYEGNWFGPWDPKTFEVEDSAFGLLKMKNGATIFIEAAWALNVLTSREAQVTVAGTLGGAETFCENPAPNSSVETGEIVFNAMKYNRMIETRQSPVSPMITSHFGDGAIKVGDRELRFWIDAIVNDTEPVVKPQQAFVVTQVLDAVYQSAASGKAVEL
ncbi:Gfo/Idh/MocA family protein [Consotaella aegiceratis]|uniref:Gfo/Idh/MocA family protein n=1 Tax=Consotaella aegiceratis TaxID=3097961 RepID=UPI002F42BDF3